MSFVISTIQWLAVGAVAYAIGYFCRRAVLKKQYFTVVYKPVAILWFGIVCIMFLEGLYVYRMGYNPMAFGKVYDTFAFLMMHHFSTFWLCTFLGFMGKKDDYIAAESASGTAKTISPAFEKKLNCALAAFLVLFAVGFWIVNTGN